MSIRFIDPEDVSRVPLHHRVSVAQGSRIVSMAGQVVWNADGELVGDGDLAAQAEQAYLNVAAALRPARRWTTPPARPSTWSGLTPGGLRR